MAIGSYSTELGGLSTLAQGFESQGDQTNAKRYRIRGTITLASQTVAAGDIVIGIADEGYLFESARITTSTSLGSTTFGIIGLDSGTTYVATGQTLTATNTPTDLPVTAAVKAGSAVTKPDRVVFRPAAATMPASGTLVIETFWTRF